MKKAWIKTLCVVLLSVGFCILASAFLLCIARRSAPVKDAETTATGENGCWHSSTEAAMGRITQRIADDPDYRIVVRGEKDERALDSFAEPPMAGSSAIEVHLYRMPDETEIDVSTRDEQPLVLEPDQEYCVDFICDVHGATDSAELLDSIPIIQDVDKVCGATNSTNLLNMPRYYYAPTHVEVGEEAVIAFGFYNADESKAFSDRLPFVVKEELDLHLHVDEDYEQEHQGAAHRIRIETKKANQESDQK